MVYLLKLFFYFFQPNKKNWENRILLIKDDALGDFLLSTGTFKQLQTHYPNKQIYILVNSPLKEIAALYFPVEQIITCDTHRFDKKIAYHYQIIKQIRSIGFETIISSMHRSSNCNKIAWNSGARNKIGYEKEFFTSKAKHFNYYTQQILSLNRIKKSTKEKYIHVIEHEAYYLSRILNTDIPAKDIPPSLPLGNEKMSHLPPFNYFVFLPEAGDLMRAVPFQKTVELIEHIYQQHQLQCVVLGSGRGYDATIFNLPFIENKIGTTRFFDALYYIKQAAFVIGNETGLLHASWIMEKPTTMIYGGGHYGRFLPLNNSCRVVSEAMPCYGCNWNCQYQEKTVPCISKISTEHILKQLKVRV
jgi:ADP-heptose:LPS heptosyltransferase